MSRARSISKVLSANDTGETGGHQAGILVPKDPTILSFFPSLPREVKNPRHLLYFRDEVGEQWEFAFIYYNNRYFGGTRDEFRLTRMTPYLKQAGLVAGDELILEHEADQGFRIRYVRARKASLTGGRLRLGGTWKIVKT